METEYLLFAITVVCAYLFGRVLAQQKANAKLSEIAIGAAAWSLCEAKALRSGAILQRVIEKHHFLEKKDEEVLSKEVKDTNQAFEAALEDLQVKRNKIIKQKDFSVDDLV